MSRSLAERAVACKGWRWMDGMRIADFPTFGWKRVTEEDVRARITYRSWLPDLDDPATLGCLMFGVLVDAYPGERLAFDWDDHATFGGWSVCRDGGPDGWLPLHRRCFPTKAEAIVAALEDTDWSPGAVP